MRNVLGIAGILLLALASPVVVFALIVILQGSTKPADLPLEVFLAFVYVIEGLLLLIAANVISRQRT